MLSQFLLPNVYSSSSSKLVKNRKISETLPTGKNSQDLSAHKIKRITTWKVQWLWAIFLFVKQFFSILQFLVKIYYYLLQEFFSSVRCTCSYNSHTIIMSITRQAKNQSIFTRSLTSKEWFDAFIPLKNLISYNIFIYFKYNFSSAVSLVQIYRERLLNQEQVFLKFRKIHRNWVCARVSFLIKLLTLIKLFNEIDDC